MKGRPLSASQRASFITALRECPNVTLACQAAGIGRRSPYQVAERDPKFKEEMEAALAQGSAALLKAVWNRTLNGIPSYVVSQGQIVRKIGSDEPLIELKFQDHIALKLISTHMPEYGPQVAKTGTDEVPADLQPDPKPTPDDPDAPSVIE